MTADRLQLEIAVRTLTSPVEGGRTENQDNYLVIDGRGEARCLVGQRRWTASIDDWPDGRHRLAILDGLGGHARGRETAEAVAVGLRGVPFGRDLDGLARSLDRLHHDLQVRINNDHGDSGTTLTLLDIEPNGSARLFHAGDSRLYRVSVDDVKCLTIDHVPSTTSLVKGHLSFDDWYHDVHEESSPYLSQAFVMGGQMAGEPLLHRGLVEVDTSRLPEELARLGDRRCLELDPEAVYLLATDGLWNLPDPGAFRAAWPGLLVSARGPLEDRLRDLFEALSERAREAAGLGRFEVGDNASAIVFRLRRSP